MKRYLLLLCFLSLLLPTPAAAQSGIRVVEDRASLSFPESATFLAGIRSSAEITSVVLEYGVDQLTCGTVIARAFPDFEPAASVEVSWTWEMLQSGSLPPGSVIWWHWVVTDASGATFTSPQQTVLWLDEVHAWQTIGGGNVNLHYYEGGSSFGNDLHATAVQALARLSQDVGLTPEEPIDLYIYASTNDMRDAILYEPSWTGGMAFPEHNSVIIGIGPADIDWGRRTEAHELTHVLIGHLTFSCLGFVPTWLNEGLAMYGEGGLEEYQQALLDRALADDSFPSLRSLGGGFSEESDRANLSYAMSYSVVNFLIQDYGRQKMTGLLNALRDGSTPDDALQALYGFDTDGLEAAWRRSIGAAAPAGPVAATPVPTPTFVPTIVPFSGVPGVLPELPVAPTPAGNDNPASTQDQTAQPGNLTGGLDLDANTLQVAGLAAVCCLVVLALGAVIFLIVRSRRGRSS